MVGGTLEGPTAGRRVVLRRPGGREGWWPVVRFLVVLAIVALFFAAPWPSTGSAEVPADSPALDSVAPSNTTEIAFEPAANAIELSSQSNATARVDLLHTTSPFVFSAGVDVARSSGPEPSTLLPIDLAVWDAAVPGEVNVTFAPSGPGGGSVEVTPWDHGPIGPSEAIAPYSNGRTDAVSVEWTPGRSLQIDVAVPGGTPVPWSALANTSDALLAGLIDSAEITVSAGVTGTAGGASLAILTNATVTLSGSTSFTAITDSPLPSLAGVLALVAVAALLAPEWWPPARALARRARSWGLGRWGARSAAFVRRHAAALLLLGGALALYASVAYTFGGHPYDQWSFKVWIDALQEGGIRGLYVQPQFVGDGVIRTVPVPWSTTGFAYGPLCAVLFAGLARIVPPLAGFPSAAALNGSVAVQAEIKFLLGSFTVAAGGVLYLAIRRATGRTGWGAVALALFVLNPAIVFDSVVWGETDSILYLVFVLFAVAAAYRPEWAMALAAVAMAFKETGPILLFPAALLVLAPGLPLLARVRRVTIAVVVLFLATLPVVWSGLLPSVVLTPYSSLFGVFVVGSHLSQPFVSPETYTVWTLFTGFAGGNGLTRLLLPSSRVLLAGISFSTLAVGLFALTWVAALALARRAAATRDLTFWFLTTAFGAVTFTALLTGTGSRYYTLALPGLAGATVLAWDRWVGGPRWAAVATYVGVSAISFWTMIGLFTVIMRTGYLTIRGLGGSYNPVSGFVSEWYANNWVITLGSAGAVALVLGTALLLRKTARGATVPPPGRDASAAPAALGPGGRGEEG